ncbi:phosphohydrolase [Patescibacteria group bacterium]|nr:phosphohydrolase [Patescibacteria group bacterium]
MSLDRQKYLEAAKSQLETNIFYHSLALEACMSGLYDYLHANNRLTANDPSKDDWLLAGLIHDIDYAGEFKESHPLRTREALAKYGLSLSDSVQKIVLAHDGRQGQNFTNLAEWSIFCADSLTGLIVAVALVYPSKKLADVKVSSVVKRFLKEPRFAAGTRRDEIAECQNPAGLNIPLEKFIEICLLSMQKIADTIAL